MTLTSRTRLLRAAACVGGLLLLTAVSGTPTTSSFLYDLETLTGSLEAGAWHDIPEACGPLNQYHKIIIYGADGPQVLPIGGEHPPPGDDGRPHPRPGNKGHVILGLGGDDSIFGGNAKDCLIGGAGDDVIYGNNGADIIIGGPGEDDLWGGNGPDDLDGGGDDDLLLGGRGDDDLDGGAGTDECHGLDADSKGGKPDVDTLALCETGAPDAKPKLMSTDPAEPKGLGPTVIEPGDAAELDERAEPAEGPVSTPQDVDETAPEPGIVDETETNDEPQSASNDASPDLSGADGDEPPIDGVEERTEQTSSQ